MVAKDTKREIAILTFLMCAPYWLFMVWVVRAGLVLQSDDGDFFCGWCDVQRFSELNVLFALIENWIYNGCSCIEIFVSLSLTQI